MGCARACTYLSRTRPPRGEDFAQIEGIDLAADVEVAEAAAIAHAPVGEHIQQVEHINGAVVREAGRLKINTPVNETLLGLIRTLEESYTKRISEWKVVSQ